MFFLLCRILDASCGEDQRLSALFTGARRQLCKKIFSTFGVNPQATCIFVVETTSFCRHPDFLKWLLQIDDYLTSVGKSQCHHIASALTVQIGISAFIDTVTRHFDCRNCLLGQVLILKVRHYNPFMVFQNRILGADAKTPGRQVAASLTLLLTVLLTLSGCGQKGPLFLPPASLAVQKTQGLTPNIYSQSSSTLPAAPSAIDASNVLDLDSAR